MSLHFSQTASGEESLQQLRAQQAALEEINNSLVAKLQQEQARSQTADEKVNSLEEKLKQEQARSQTEVNFLTSQNRALSNRVQRLAMRKVELEIENSVLSREAEALRVENLHLDCSRKVLTNENKALHTKMESLQGELKLGAENFQKKLASLKSKTSKVITGLLGKSSSRSRRITSQDDTTYADSDIAVNFAVSKPELEDQVLELLSKVCDGELTESAALGELQRLQCSVKTEVLRSSGVAGVPDLANSQTAANADYSLMPQLVLNQPEKLRKLLSIAAASQSGEHTPASGLVFGDLSNKVTSPSSPNPHFDVVGKFLSRKLPSMGQAVSVKTSSKESKPKLISNSKPTSMKEKKESRPSFSLSGLFVDNEVRASSNQSKTQQAVAFSWFRSSPVEDGLGNSLSSPDAHDFAHERDTQLANVTWR